MTKLLLWLGLVLYSVNDKDHKAMNYFDNYKDLAISEMKRSGIPASIKLAQAALESNYGSSTFARNSNNHFGIKCKQWKGAVYYHPDDDYDVNGDLIDSCFRAYLDVVDSFVDHSNFLKGSIQYEGLFELPKQDYKAWAKALYAFGYATDEDYAGKLIRLVEKYQLTQYDEL